MEGEKESPSVQAIEKLQLLQRVVESQKALAKLTSRCYRRCVASGSRDSKGLTAKEKQCIWNCAQNFLESSEFVSARIAMAEDVPTTRSTDTSSAKSS